MSSQTISKLTVAAGLHALAKQGITLTNYHGVTHPSQPNYVASVGGDLHGVHTDTHHRIDKSVHTIVDLLEAKGVSWSEYQEEMPYSGFQGDWKNQENGKNNYVRKHKYALHFLNHPWSWKLTETAP